MFDPEQLVKQAIQSNYDPTVLENVHQELDFPWAENWFQFLTGEEFLNIVPFPTQVKIGTLLFEDYCPICSDVEYLNNLYNEPIREIPEKVIFLKDGVCPVCGRTWYDFYSEGKFNAYQELHICAGQRGGKTALTAMLAGYILHRYLRIPNISKYFRLLPQTFHMTFTALTVTQAYTIIWQEFKDMVISSPWFQNYINTYKKLERETGETYIKVLDKEIKFEHKKIVVGIAPPDKRTLRGKTRIFTSIDELGWFDTDEKLLKDANGARKALVNSLQTVRSAAFSRLKEGDFYPWLTAWEINISSPSRVNDMIMTLVKKSANQRNALAFHLPTWELNPNVTRESLMQSLEPGQDFERDFAAIPPMTNNPWYKDLDTVVSLCRDRGQEDFWTWIQHKDDKTGRTWAEIGKLIHDKTTPRIIAVDTGFSNNAFAVGVFSWNKSGFVVDGVLEVRPDTNHVVDFPKMYDKVISVLINQLFIVKILFDRWNSLDFVQKLQHEGYNVQQISLRYNHFSRIKGAVSQSSFPKPEFPLEEIKYTQHLLEELIEGRPVFHFLVQLLTVRDLGTKVVKPLKGDDDIFRTYALALWYWLEYKEELEKFLSSPRKSSNPINNIHIAAVYRKYTEKARGSQGNIILGNNSPMVVVRRKTK